MTTLNSYATLAEFKNWAKITSSDNTDDAVIEYILKGASRAIDNFCGRRFYPSVETHYFDVPRGDEIEPRKLRLDDDFLSIISVTNGDGTSIASSEYDLIDKNKTPYYAIRLLDNSTTIWASDGAGNTHNIIAVTGIIGCHYRLANAWLAASTLAEDLDTTETGVDVASGTQFAVGNIVKIGNELGYISAVASNTLTSTRGENGSAAATHTTGDAVYIWQVMDDIREACLMLAEAEYHQRFGENSSAVATITGAGVVISPRGMPATVKNILTPYRKFV